MHRPPPLVDLPRYPVTAGTGLLAIGVTLAWWSKQVDISPLLADINVRRGEIWRVLTSTLPHVDFLHLLFNLYWTWVFGTLIELTWGHLRTAALFVVLAVAANGAEFAILSGGVGLSGIGYGLFGMLWVLTKRDRRFQDVVDNRTAFTFVIWFFICIVGTINGVFPVANIAHGVGALTGALIGWTITVSGAKKAAGIAGAVTFTAAVVVGDTVGRPFVNRSKERGQGEAAIAYQMMVAKNYPESYRWFRDALRQKPEAAEYWYDFGITCENLDRPAEASDAFKRAATLNPNDPQYRDAAREYQ